MRGKNVLSRLGDVRYRISGLRTVLKEFQGRIQGRNWTPETAISSRCTIQRGISDSFNLDTRKKRPYILCR